MGGFKGQITTQGANHICLERIGNHAFGVVGWFGDLYTAAAAAKDRSETTGRPVMVVKVMGITEVHENPEGRKK